jgi:hypothetical protein
MGKKWWNQEENVTFNLTGPVFYGFAAYKLPTPHYLF